MYLLLALALAFTGIEGHSAVVLAAEMTAANLTEDQAEELVVNSFWYSEKIPETKELMAELEAAGYSKAVMKKAYLLVVKKYGSKEKAILHYNEQFGGDYKTIFNNLYQAYVGKSKPTGGNIAKMDIFSMDEQLYTGKNIKPSVTIMDGSYTLKKGTDYIVRYKNNKAIGKATVTIKGKGKYSGSVKKSFSIVAVKTSDIAALYLNMAELVGKDVHLAWSQSGNGESDGIQILRSSKEDGTYQVLDTLTDAESENRSKNGYIDTTANGKAYYYAVRAIVKVSGKTYKGEIQNKIKAYESTADWYRSDSGYVRVESYEGKMEGFVEYTKDGKVSWRCDWPSNASEGEVTWVDAKTEETNTDTINYDLYTPGEYYDQGVNVQVNVFYGKSDFYYIWVQDGTGFKKAFQKV
ncbi:MAG: hypothetical protein PWP24_1978 [Clostridiales bacterium]|nr:hypothetical protein [Clostridiales bacterium]